MLNGSAQSLPRKPRQLRLPDDHVKVVIRQRDGLNLSKVGEAQLCDAILCDVDLHATLLEEDIYRTCVEANLIVVNTPHLSNAEIYSRISKVLVETETYDVRAYVTSPENRAKGVMQILPSYDYPDDISTSLVNDHNPTILQARRMGKTNTVLIVFEGVFRVAKPTTQVTKPVLDATRHLTFSFIVAKKKAKLQQQQYLSTMISTQDAHPERQEVKPSDTHCCCPSPTSKRRRSRSRSKHRRKNQPQELLLGSAAPTALGGAPLQQRQPGLTLAHGERYFLLRALATPTASLG
ncbi:hypothetical protein HPB51_015330 [Rhipicephalus microplus]|uniref:Uncharacterized protein n=1 Tax=Rhipicephalus microplus TaxID=6941 RepID=A0A9J6DGL6_RHIMP|nr:hypothetical protein HPB51_015330 [Rhipicephalus microplus]